MKTALKAVSRRPAYQPVLSEDERRAYEAAHRIMTADIRVTEWGTPGKQRSEIADRIAAIILDVIRRPE